MEGQAESLDAAGRVRFGLIGLGRPAEEFFRRTIRYKTAHFAANWDDWVGWAGELRGAEGEAKGQMRLVSLRV